MIGNFREPAHWKLPRSWSVAGRGRTICLQSDIAISIEPYKNEENRWLTKSSLDSSIDRRLRPLT